MENKNIDGLFDTEITFESINDLLKFYSVFSRVDGFDHSYRIVDNVLYFFDDEDEDLTHLEDLIESVSRLTKVKIVKLENNLNTEPTGER